MINKNKVEIIFFAVLFAIAAVLMFLVFQPFLTVLFLASTFAIVLFPLYKKILNICKQKETLSALLTVIIGLVFVIIPIIFLGQQAFKEAYHLYERLSVQDVSEFGAIARAIETPIRQFVPSFSLNIDQYVEFVLGWATDNFKDVLFGTLSIVTNLFLIIIALFFLIRDGEKFLEKIVRLSPLHDTYDNELLEKTTSTIATVVKGTLLIALIQGTLAGIGLAIFGVPNAVLLGALAALCAFIPGLGTAIVVIPSVIYLFLSGNIPFALGLSAWGILLVSTIDNILGPYLYKKGTRLHQLVVLFAVLGGISFFGPEGILVGPVIASFFVSLMHIYEKMIIAN